MPLLQIKLLGDFSLLYDNQTVTGVLTARAQSLLTYLILRRGAPQSRQHLAFLFWPDSHEGQARTNLRQLLHHLRRSFPLVDQFLEITAQTLQWRIDSKHHLDVSEFERLADVADGTNPSAGPSATVSKLEKAVALYDGKLLPACYEDWILLDRERLEGLFLSTLERLIALLEKQGQYKAAIRYAECLLQHDPVQESATLQLMRLTALSGERAKALRIYHACVTVLHRELGVSPGPAVREVYERLLSLETASTRAKKPQVDLVENFPLTGRKEAWEKLQHLWQKSARGASHFVAITGEAGIGKSRLAQEMEAWARRQGIATAWTRSYDVEGNLAHASAVDCLRAPALIPGLKKLEPIWLTEISRLLPEILTEHPDLTRPAPLTDDLQRQRLFEALNRAILIQKHPVMLLIDDFQWCDGESRKWLHHLLRFDRHAPLLIVATIRTGDAQIETSLSPLLLALHRSGQFSEIKLVPLDEAETRSLAKHLEDQNPDPALEAQLYRETEGNPLFVVEYIRAKLSLKDGTGTAVDLETLPPKVQAVIQARLGQLSPHAKALIGVASVIGRAFTMDVLAKTSESTEDLLVAALDELWQRRMIREHSAEAYDFSHDKIREVAYAEISPMRRRLLHRKAAQALESIYKENLDAVSAQIAGHYERAHCPEKAILYYQWAAGVTQRIFANEDTIHLFKRALSLLKTLPENRDRTAQELALQTSLGIPLVAIKGYGASEVMTTLSRAQTLCTQIGKSPDPPILRALAIAHLVRGQLQQACELGGQLLHRAEDSKNDILHVEAHYVLGVSFFWMGKFPSARAQLERALSFYHPKRHHSHITLYSQDAGVICLSRLSYLLWFIGQPEDALIKSGEALELAQQLAHPFSLAYALNFATWLHHDCRKEQRARTLAEKAEALSNEHRLGFLNPMGKIFQGFYLSKDGDIERGITLVREALSEYETTEQHLYRPYALSLLARIYTDARAYEPAFDALDKALSLSKTFGLHFWDAEIYRLKGETLLQQGEKDHAEAETQFQMALDVSQTQEAKALALRAAISLGRLWYDLKSTQKKTQAAEMLEQMIRLFPKDFETQDLKDAKALLIKLSQK